MAALERVDTVSRLRERVKGWRAEGRIVGFVPTMGALHAGHRALMEQARAECGAVVASVFVNPKQFGPDEDFDRYPRTLEEDLVVASGAGVDAVFCPSVEDVYPPGFQTTVSVGPLTQRLCGLARPGHFDGVTTVVARLFGLVGAQRAYFGQKDYQQAQVIRRMTADLGLEPEIVVCPIVREADGLALSSRNRYLSPEARGRARAVPDSLARGAERFAEGVRDPGPVLAEMVCVLEAAGAEVEYVAACHPKTLEPVPELVPGTVLLVAARVETTRLIDNRIL
ncbi:MAG: pantoate--beta-alanine ligase [Nitrospirota bacterium]|nr:pantoate--beta-alanine ligase [Nitrospirota bacterium]